MERSRLQESAYLSRLFCEDAMDLEGVVRVLRAAGVGFVIVGAYGCARWMRPRATLDIDLVIRPGDHERAVQAIGRAYPELQAIDLPIVTRFAPPGKPSSESVLDLMKPAGQPVLMAVFDHVVPGEPGPVPNLEMAVALKFAAMVSPNRARDDKLQDAADLARMALRNPTLDLVVLARLGDLVYAQGGAEVVRIVGDIRGGRPLVF